MRLIQATLAAILICLILITVQSLTSGSYSRVYRTSNGTSLMVEANLSYASCLSSLIGLDQSFACVEQ